MKLSKWFEDLSVRNAVIDDCCQLVDDEVRKKSGMSGMVIKTGYKAVSGIKPGFVRKVVNSLLDEWVDAINPIWLEADEKNTPPATYLLSQEDRVADALLSVTDRKATHAKSPVVGKTYKKLRPLAKKNVVQAVPGLVNVLAKHAKD